MKEIEFTCTKTLVRRGYVEVDDSADYDEIEEAIHDKVEEEDEWDDEDIYITIEEI